jgi:hypothetical protein
MLVVPLQAVPNQQLQVQIGGQAVSLNVYQESYGLFMDVTANDIPIITGVICLNLNRIVRDLYLGFLGDFIFADTTGAGADPVYTGFGARFVLLWLAPTDLPPGQG